MNKRAPLTLVVGMHRSGTSLLGSLLPACGIAMPGPLLDGDPHNPEGYFEHADITQIQEQLLIELDRWWPSARGVQALPNDWLTKGATQQAITQLSRTLQREIINQSGDWAIKDPRSSLLLPLWFKVCKQLNIQLKLLLAIRDPKEVIMSLVQRDGAFTGMDEWRAQQLWWHHNAQVLRTRGKIPLQIISYSHWFNPLTADQQLHQLAPNSTETQRKNAMKAIKPQHRRSDRLQSCRPLHPSISKMYEYLHAAALDPKTTALNEQWFLQQTAPPSLPPPKGKRARMSRWKQTLQNRIRRHESKEHPWSYFAAMRTGSDPGAIRQQISRWHQVGFNQEELRHAASLPGYAPKTSLNIHKTIAEDHNDFINQTDITPGLKSARYLLRLSNFSEVRDDNQGRVIQLRQFGINAVWMEN